MYFSRDLRYVTFDFSESPYQTLNIALNIIIYPY